MDQDENYQDGNAIYYLAQAYRNLGDNEKAAEYYQKMIALYPGTERAANSQQYLDAMGVSTDGNASTDGATPTDGSTPENGDAPTDGGDGTQPE